MRRFMMSEITDYIYRILVHPAEALRDVTKMEKMKVGGMLWLFVIVLMTLSSFKFDSGWLIGFAVMVILSGLGILLHSAVIDYISGFFGGRGSAKGITTGFLCAYVPYAFIVFFMLLKEMGLEVVSGILVIFVVIWNFILEVVAVRENYEFTTTKAFFISLSPAIIFVGFVFALLLIAMIAVVAGFSEATPVLENVINSPL